MICGAYMWWLANTTDERQPTDMACQKSFPRLNARLLDGPENKT